MVAFLINFITENQRHFMDKRSILFVLSVTLSLGLINFWFDTQRQKEQTEWNARQKTKLEQTVGENQENTSQSSANNTANTGNFLKPLDAALNLPETYFVLENAYQQLVFSNIGGALVEINLPFKSTEDKESPVKEIGYDREMVENHPYNALFPSRSYFTPGNNPEKDFIRHEKGHLGGYYPLIRRDLIQTPPRQTINVPPKFYAANIVSEYPELAETNYTVKHFDQNSIVFEAVTGQRKITKTYSIASEDKGAPYCIDLQIDVEGNSHGLWLTSGVPEVEWISGAPAPALKVRQTRNQQSQVDSLSLPEEVMVTTSVLPDWICNSNGFFGIILDALTPTDLGYKAQFVPGSSIPSRLVEIEQNYNVFPPEKLPGYQMMLPLKSDGGSMKFRIFAGPFSSAILKEVDNTFSDPAAGYNPDYIASQTFTGGLLLFHSRSQNFFSF